jgi:predicted PurR-regulated permease PerM
METNRPVDLARVTFQLLTLGALIATSFWILRPFLVALTWASMIVVATWPLLLHAQAWLGGRRGPAVAVMTLALLLVLVVPLYFGVSAIIDNGKRIADWSSALATITLPEPPTWLGSIPLLGSKLTDFWQQLTAAHSEEIVARVKPYAHGLVVWFAGAVGGIGLLLVQFLLTTVIAAILYANGETAADAADRFARRLAGPRGEAAVHLAGQAVRGVALGVVVTAVCQSVAAGIGIALAGVPFASILTAIIFVLCIAQVGPGLVLIPSVFWVFSQRGGVWGTGFLIWAIFCLTFDNFLRPVLIRRGANLPLLLIFTGVIGGLMSFGIIGLFIGPVVLAVAYTLFAEWVSAGTADQPG